MNWTIEPYVGVGPLKFGMSIEEVEELIGPAESGRDPASSFSAIPGKEDKYQGYYTEFRTFVEGDRDLSKPVVTYKDEKLNTIEFWDTHETLSLGNIVFFSEDMSKVIEKLILASETVIEYYAGYIFPDFGISMFNEEYYDSGDPIAVFARGEFVDSIKEGLKDGTKRYLKGGPE